MCFHKPNPKIPLEVDELSLYDRLINGHLIQKPFTNVKVLHETKHCEDEPVDQRSSDPKTLREREVP